MEHEEGVDVLVIGEALIDVVESDAGRSEHVGGSPANVALGLGRRGFETALLTQLGDDEHGWQIAAHLRASGVRILPESFTALRTSTATAQIQPDGGAGYRFDISWSAGRPDIWLPRARMLHAGSLAVFLEPGGTWLLELLRRSDSRWITFDPNIRPQLLGAHADVLDRFEQVARLARAVKLSDEDADWLFPGRPLDDVIDALLELGPTLVAITSGGDGAILATRSHRAHVPAARVDVHDTIGAGDTFMASLIASVLSHDGEPYGLDDLREMGTDAVRSAAITVSRPGADLPWKREIEVAS